MPRRLASWRSCRETARTYERWLHVTSRYKDKGNDGLVRLYLFSVASWSRTLFPVIFHSLTHTDPGVSVTCSTSPLVAAGVCVCVCVCVCVYACVCACVRVCV